MNIFVLDNDPAIAAQYHCDKHVVKMTLEIAQLLCTTATLSGWTSPYKPTHVNHPCAIWVRSSMENWLWTIEHGLAIAAEYTKRYSKEHKSEAVIRWCFDNVPELPEVGMTKFAQAMPEEYRCIDAVKAYREYYRQGKKDIATWKHGEVPYWF